MAVIVADWRVVVNAAAAGQPTVEPEVVATGLVVAVGSGEFGPVGLGQPAVSSVATAVQLVRPGRLVAVSHVAFA